METFDRYKVNLRKIGNDIYSYDTRVAEIKDDKLYDLQITIFLNPKLQAPNYKWFDKLTTVSLSNGLSNHLLFGYCDLGFKQVHTVKGWAIKALPPAD